MAPVGPGAVDAPVTTRQVIEPMVGTLPLLALFRFFERKFRALAAEVSGEDLQGFFDAWLSSPTRPDATAANGL